MSTTWGLREFESGASWQAGMIGLAAGDALYDGKAVLAGYLGNLTNWTLSTKN